MSLPPESSSTLVNPTYFLDCACTRERGRGKGEEKYVWQNSPCVPSVEYGSAIWDCNRSQASALESIILGGAKCSFKLDQGHLV